MKRELLILGLFVFMLAACGGKKERKKAIPKVLEGKSVSADEISKRYNTDLLEGLYTELVDKSPELKQLEDDIRRMGKVQKDSISAFVNYDGKNRLYFSSANTHLALIQDSVLRARIKILIDSSIAQYDTTVVPHNTLLKYIGERNVTLKDLHNVLKITKTIPMIQEYQRDNLPEAKSLEGFSKQLDRAIKQADTLSKQ